MPMAFELAPPPPLPPQIENNIMLRGPWYLIKRWAIHGDCAPSKRLNFFHHFALDFCYT